MSTSSNSFQGEKTYVIDAENATEMARLMNQDRLTTHSMGGIFPEQFEASRFHDILDIACGPGGWVLDVAFAHPEFQIVGFDSSKTMIEYARASARVSGLSNVNFRIMDALHPLDFADNSFDLVNARYIVGFMFPEMWPKLLHECMRITRPGGIIRLTESEFGITSSPAVEMLHGLLTTAGKLAGRSFSPDGRHVGITPMLGRFLRDAGCHKIELKAYSIDFSAGSEGNSSYSQDMKVGFKLLQPFLIKMGVVTADEFDRLYQQMLEEMLAENFCGIVYLLSAWGYKP